MYERYSGPVTLWTASSHCDILNRLGFKMMTVTWIFLPPFQVHLSSNQERVVSKAKAPFSHQIFDSR